ncbi:DUF222 domain-containing protein [Mycobacterium saskatchewanense]|uniref:DUF222 domain-containing protein n=1 Tax=Mycobacterium saskatchewanense TaxID=220927 RepID=UPI0013CFE7DD|nr:DUF222 domain-containing protein [Mycobacterium saskatchewanense]
MCDTLSVSELRSATDGQLAAMIGAGARDEARAAARRLAAIAEFVVRHADGPTESAHWSCDNWDAMAAEVAAAGHVSHAMASGQMYLAVALRSRLSRVGALLARGVIGVRLASAIVWHTDLIKDPDTLRLVDEALGEDAAQFGPLSVAKAGQRIDAIVSRHDPAAVRRYRAGARGRHVSITPADDASGTAGLWGSLYATDAAVLDRRLTQLARQVCDHDPRTVEQRRADALGALAAGAQTLACGCANPDCPARSEVDPRAAAVTIHVVADAAALTAPPDPHTSGQPERRPLTPEMTLAEALAPDPEPGPPTPLPPAAHLTGGATLPAALIAELARAGARVSPLLMAAGAPAEPGYRPSAALARFVRCRDLTCRFPGCDRPADLTDIDHTIAYPAGPTHPSKVRCC